MPNETVRNDTARAPPRTNVHPNGLIRANHPTLDGMVVDDSLNPILMLINAHRQLPRLVVVEQADAVICIFEEHHVKEIWDGRLEMLENPLGFDADFLITAGSYSVVEFCRSDSAADRVRVGMVVAHEDAFSKRSLLPTIYLSHLFILLYFIR